MMYIGAAAALTTACTWALSSVIHAGIARKIGVHSLLLLRQPLCVVFLGTAAWLTGELVWHEPYWVLMGALSGLVAIFLHDWIFYESIARVGVRCALVCNSLSAVCTALLGVLFLGEELGWQGLCGVLVSTGGVMLVVNAEHNRAASDKEAKVLGSPAASGRTYVIGVSLALCTAVLMAVGMILAKAAISNGVTPLYMALLRNAVAMIGFFFTACLLRSFVSTLQKAKATPHLFWLLVLGCLLGPGGGTWLFMVAIQNTSAAIAATLVGLEPIALLLVTGIWERRCPAIGSILGSLTACAGVALLLWR